MTINKSVESILDSQLDIVSVEDFFKQINWYGGRLSKADDLAMAATLYETVGQFFGTFPWSGSTATVPSPDWNSSTDDEIIPLKTDTLTLEDLSALF